MEKEETLFNKGEGRSPGRTLNFPRAGIREGGERRKI